MKVVGEGVLSEYEEKEERRARAGVLFSFREFSKLCVFLRLESLLLLVLLNLTRHVTNYYYYCYCQSKTISFTLFYSSLVPLVPRIFKLLGQQLPLASRQLRLGWQRRRRRRRRRGYRSDTALEGTVPQGKTIGAPPSPSSERTSNSDDGDRAERG